MTPLKQKLKELNACQEAIEWVGERTIEQAVNDCHRGDWLIWLGQKIGIDNYKLIATKEHCANISRYLRKEHEVMTAIELSSAYRSRKRGARGFISSASPLPYTSAFNKANQKQTADICRAHIGQLIIDKFNEL
jgi:hypothetical protein